MIRVYDFCKYITFAAFLFCTTACSLNSSSTADLEFEISPSGLLKDTVFSIEPFTHYSGKLTIHNLSSFDQQCYIYVGEFSSISIDTFLTGYAEFPEYQSTLDNPLYIPIKLEANSNKSYNYSAYHFNSYNVPYAYKPRIILENDIENKIREYESATKKQIILYTFILGLLVAILSYAVINLFIHRELYFLFYIIYLTGSIFYALLEDERHLEFNILFSNNSSSYIYFYSFFNLISIIAYINFFKLFLKIKDNERVLYHIINVLTVVLSISIIVDFVLNSNGYYVLAFYQSLIARLTALFLGIYSIVLLYRRKDKITNLILLGTLVWLITTMAYTIVGILKSKGVISSEYYFNPHLILQIGTLIELVLFNTAINSRQRETELSGKFNSEKLKIFEEGNTRIQNFYTSITHEFKTPLTMIMGMANEVKNEDLEKGIKKNANSLLSLIDQLLHLSRNTNINGSVLNNVNINEFLESITDAFRDMAVHKSISLVFHSNVKEIFLKFDEEKLRYVLTNILKNAFDHTPKFGSIIVSLALHEPDRISISIKDSGEGIVQEDIPFIFDKFFKGQNATEYGSGIGLTMAKEYIESMKGSIEVESTIKRGSTFIVHLPMIKSEASHTSALSNHEEKFRLSVDLEVEFDHEMDSKILIVEDNYEISNMLQRILKPSYRIISASDGEDGLNLCQQEIPDLIITDLMMPRLDGIGMIKKLKSDPATSHIPIIVISAKSEEVDIVQAKNAGATSYIKKPFNQQILFAEIQQILRQIEIYQEYYQKNNDILEGESQDPFIQKFQLLVAEKLNDPNLNMTYLSRNLYLERTQVFRKVKAITGMSPTELIRKQRIVFAQKLLKNTNEPISNIAEQCGYTDASQFSVAFKAVTGMTPTAFRK